MNPQRLKRLWHLEEMQKRIALLERAAAEALQAMRAQAAQQAEQALWTELDRQETARLGAQSGLDLLEGDACLSALRQERQQAAKDLVEAEEVQIQAREVFLDRDRRGKQARRLWERVALQERLQVARREGREADGRIGGTTGGPGTPAS